MQHKSKENMLSAKILLAECRSNGPNDPKYYNAIIHCIYYSLLQFMKHCEPTIPTTGKRGHITFFEKVGKKVEKKIQRKQALKREFLKFSAELLHMNKLRKTADYEQADTPFKDCVKALKISERIIKALGELYQKQTDFLNI